MGKKKLKGCDIGFDGPTAPPKSPVEAGQWQKANRLWWEGNPMRYDWKEAIGKEHLTREYFVEIDRRFFSEVMKYMPWKKTPFDNLIEFDSLKESDVLEIGVGSGSVAQLLASHARSFVGIDITDYAVKSTSERMRLFGLNGKIIRTDAEQMPFDDDSFDFIWSWGVIHHSSDTRRVLGEMRRVLRPGGVAVTMVYHRGLFNYYLIGGLFYVLRGGPLGRITLNRAVQERTDGAIARYYTTNEWTNLASGFFEVEKAFVTGQKSEIIPLPGGRAKRLVSSLTPDRISRFFTDRLRCGSFLVTKLKKT